MDTNQTNAFADSFIPLTSRDWNALPEYVFPATFSIHSSKTYLFYGYYHGVCSDEIKSIIPQKFHLYQTHDFLRLNTLRRPNWILAEQMHEPIGLFLWRLETGTLFPSLSGSINHQFFKTNIYRYLQLRPNSWNIFLFSRYRSPPWTTKVVPFWCNFFFYPYHYKKKNITYIISIQFRRAGKKNFDGHPNIHTYINIIFVYGRSQYKSVSSTGIKNFICNETIVSRALPSSSVNYNWFTGKNVWLRLTNVNIVGK